MADLSHKCAKLLTKKFQGYSKDLFELEEYSVIIDANLQSLREMGTSATPSRI